MKAKSILFTFALLIFFSFTGAQAPGAINYQGVARDNTGAVIPNQSIGVEFRIVSGLAAGPIEYSETHTVTTNDFGLFVLQIGQGSVASGTFSNIAWGGDAHFLYVGIDPAGGTSYQAIGTSQLISVPYALHAKTVEVDNVDDADNDPTNEFQTVSQSGTIVTLSNGGGAINVADYDNNSSNELQNLALTGNTLTISGGNSVTLVDNVNDADADSTNELQNISKSGSTVTLSNGGGSFTDDVNDADNNPSNELQTISVTGSNLTISNGNTISIPGDNDWVDSTSTLYNVTATNFGFGTSAPHSFSKVDIRPGEQLYGIYMKHERFDSGPAVGISIDLDQNGSGAAYSTGINVSTTLSQGGDPVYGGSFYSENKGAGSSYGLQVSTSKTQSTGASYGVFSTVSGSASSKWAGYFNGNVYSTGTFQSSDRKLKTNITNFSGALEKLKSIGTYSYNYKDKYSWMNLPGGEQIGLLAEDVQQTFPHLTTKVVQPPHIMPEKDAANWVGEGNYQLDEEGNVIVGEEVEFIGVNYAGLVPVLVQAIKEQQAQIEKLKQKASEVDQLREELNELRELINK